MNRIKFTHTDLFKFFGTGIYNTTNGTTTSRSLYLHRIYWSILRKGLRFYGEFMDKKGKVFSS